MLLDIALTPHQPDISFRLDKRGCAVNKVHKIIEICKRVEMEKDGIQCIKGYWDNATTSRANVLPS